MIFYKKLLSVLRDQLKVSGTDVLTLGGVHKVILTPTSNTPSCIRSCMSDVSLMICIHCFFFAAGFMKGCMKICIQDPQWLPRIIHKTH